MKKTKGVLLNLIINLAKSLPAIILAAAVFAMAAYVVCVNIIPIGYCSEAEFSLSGVEGLKDDGFYADVAEEYSSLSGILSADRAKKLFTLTQKGEGMFLLLVKTTEPETSYALMNAVLAVAERIAAEQGGSYSLISSDGIPTSLSRGDISPYIFAAAAIGAAVLLFSALKKGLACSAIGSEKEFTRIMKVKLLGTLPYSAHPLSRHKPVKAKSE